MRETRFRYRPTGGPVSLSWTPSGLLGVGGQRHGPPVFCGSRALTNVLRPRGHVPQPRGARPAGEGPRACHTLPSGGLASVPRVLSLSLAVLEDSPRGGTPHHTDTLGWLTCAHSPPAAGAVVLDVTCFAEAERLYMLVRDTAVHGRPLTALVLPEVLVSGHWAWAGRRLLQPVRLMLRCLLHTPKSHKWETWPEATGQGTSWTPGRPLPSALGSLGLAGLPCPAGLGSLLGASGQQVVLPDASLPGRGVLGGQGRERVGTAVGTTAEAGRGPEPWSPPCALRLPAASGPRPC